MKVFGKNMVTAQDLYNLMRSLISSNLKQTQSGWLSFNAPCCPHVDAKHRPDRLKRAGIKFSNNGGIVYHCFNCGYSTGWKPGLNLSKKFKSLLEWMGLDVGSIDKLSFNIWKDNKNNPDLLDNQTDYKAVEQAMNFESINLPSGSQRLLDSVIKSPCEDNVDQLKYLESRGEYILSRANDFYFTTSTKDTMNRRIIIPFYWKDEIVGYVGRSIDNNKFKYFGYIPANYIFNTGVIKKEHKFVTVVEGPFDALSINGVALLGDKCSRTQENWLNNLNKDIIVIPDNDGKDSEIEKVAKRNNWYVSRPDFGPNVKDCADAVKQFGQLYTLYRIFDYKMRI